MAAGGGVEENGVGDDCQARVFGGICDQMREIGGVVMVHVEHTGAAGRLVFAETGEPNPMTTRQSCPFPLR